MCCFSRPVDSVSDTKIFARMLEEGKQGLVYSMQFSADEDLAMVLPLPVKDGAGEDALEFINLEEYDDFFRDMERGFPRPRAGGLSRSRADAARLEVVEVGSFEASFVPTVADFERLDPRFRLPAGTWEALPLYRDYGFAVFKLKSEDHGIHPMAFVFETRRLDRLFFPTVHIHDGEIHERAGFDHVLYCQLPAMYDRRLNRWQESSSTVDAFIDIENAQGLVDADGHCYRRRLGGQLRNEDTWV